MSAENVEPTLYEAILALLAESNTADLPTERWRDYVATVLRYLPSLPAEDARAELARDTGVDGINSRLDAARSEMTKRLFQWNDPVRAWSDPSLITQLISAQIDLRGKVAQQLPEAAETARQIPDDSPLAQAAEGIADALQKIDVSKAGPVAFVILLFWLIFFHMNMGQIAGMTLFYMVLSDYLKKQD